MKKAALILAILVCPALFALGARPITVQGVATLVGFVLSGYGAFRLVRTLSGSSCSSLASQTRASDGWPQRASHSV